MATRSTITLYCEQENVYKSIYCHWDGDLKGVGNTLLRHYSDINRVKKLLELGNLVSCKKNIEVPEGKLHNFKFPFPNVCIAFDRDLNSKETDYKKIHDTLLTIDVQDYNYLFTDNKWNIVICDFVNKLRHVKPLDKEIQEVFYNALSNNTVTIVE